MELTIDPTFWGNLGGAIVGMAGSVFWSMLWTLLFSVVTVCLSLKISPMQIDDYLLDNDKQDIRIGATFLTYGLAFGMIFGQYHTVPDPRIYSDLENWIWFGTGMTMAIGVSYVTRLSLFAVLALMNGRPVKGFYQAEMRADKNVALFLVKLGVRGLALLVCLVPLISG
jgi:hypothetical protein